MQIKAEIRRMTCEDLPEVMNIEREVFSDPWQEVMFQQELLAETAFVMEMVPDKELIGYLCGLQVLDEYMITNIAIRKERQHCGFGTMLLLYVIQILRNCKLKSCFLEVRSKNKAAINFYLKHNFETFGARKNYYRDPVDDALIIKLDL